MGDIQQHASLPISLFWFRRDLRLNDNKALHAALMGKHPVLPIFIFDEAIIGSLPADDPRVWFIYKTLEEIDRKLQRYGSRLYVFRGDPLLIFQQLFAEFCIAHVFFNCDFEPYGIKRDQRIVEFCATKQAIVHSCCDHVVFHPQRIQKKDETPYTVYTPYKKRWVDELQKIGIEEPLVPYLQKLFRSVGAFPESSSLGIRRSAMNVRAFALDSLSNYYETRDFPYLDSGSYFGPHLRFGTISVREIVRLALQQSEVFLSELIWREFFIQILFHFPYVTDSAFRKKYNAIEWKNNEAEFACWCRGETGYAFVDAGMRQLNATGYMHNRVRMVVASFLCKHLRIDWRWGESYFAEKLLDYELASNNGNWQWAAGTGCDAAPYFRVFNPMAQQKKFDPDGVYISRWISGYSPENYTPPMVDHAQARKEAIDMYKRCGGR